MLERDLQHAVRLRLGREADLCLWRNSAGATEEWNPDTAKARTIRYGLAPGAADLIGLLRPNGRFFALELKTDRGRLSPEQVRWLDLVRSFGGFAGVARSVDEAVEALERARKGMFQ